MHIKKATQTILIGLAGTAIIFFLAVQKKPDPSLAISAPSEQAAVIEPVPVKLVFGIPADEYKIVTSKVKKNQIFSDLFGSYGADEVKLNLLAANNKDVFNVRRLRTGNQYHIFLNNENNPELGVYEINQVDFVVFDFKRDSMYLGAKEVTLKRKAATGIIKSSLYQTLSENDLDQALAMELSDVFAWVVDFYRLQKGDNFKVIYHERVIEGEPAGIEKIEAAVFNHNGNEFFAFYFKPMGEDRGSYFDEAAQSLRKAFLKAPLKYSRISSRYSKSRLHPVLKTHRPHLGVDYAAPAGTPILAVGDGVVEESMYKKNNGNYVKIRHNSTYSTQYLHMSGFAKGIRRGAKVTQGQVIGYVGSTGLATGPHVCFRFWKNGRQVDPLKVDIPPSEPVKKQYLDEYNRQVAELRAELDEI